MNNLLAAEQQSTNYLPKQNDATMNHIPVNAKSTVQGSADYHNLKL